MADPTLNQDAATKSYVDSNAGIRQTNADLRYYLQTTPLNDITPPTNNLSLNNQKIQNLATPTLNTDAVTKGYVDTNSGISQTNADSRYYLNTVELNNITLPSGTLSMNTHKISNLIDPTLSQDAATKNYVDLNTGIS